MERIVQLKAIMLDCVKSYSEQSGNDVTVDDETPLLGPNAVLDSLGLVMVVTSFEAKVNETFDTQIVLANERAMSMKRSPFRSVAAMSSYAAELLEQQESSAA